MKAKVLNDWNIVRIVETGTIGIIRNDCLPANMSRDEVKKHNQREWEHKKYSGEICPQSCAYRSKPHQHICEAKLIDWDGRRIPDPEYPYELVGLAVPVV